MAGAGEALLGYVRAHGKECRHAIPPETRNTAAKAYSVLMKQPELGASVKGYNEFVLLLKHTLLGADAK